MASVEITRQQTVAYTPQGDAVRRDEAFMKFLVEFRRDGSLRRLKGAPLSLFILLGLHEAEILTNGTVPLTVTDMVLETAYSKPTVTTALDFLVATNYVQELDGRGDRNEKRYRVKSYMWFGAQRTNTSSSAASKDNLLSSGSAPNVGAPLAPTKLAKNFYPRREKIFSPIVVADSFSKEHSESEKQQTTQATANAPIKNILRDCGIKGKAFLTLSETVSLETAREWSVWLKTAPKPKGMNYPTGIMISALTADPEAKPDMPQAEPEPAPRRNPTEWQISPALRARMEAADNAEDDK